MQDVWAGSADLPIWGFVVRAFIVYFYIFIILKILGQRSIGTIHPLDFLFAVIIGDVLGEPLSDGEMPMRGPVAGAAFISSLHLILSFVALKAPRFRRVIEDEPIILIEKGKILKKQLSKTKITVESLLMDLRIRNAPYLSEIDYAVLESNGQISVIKKTDDNVLTPNDMNLPSSTNKGYPTVLLLDGQINHHNLNKIGNVKWLKEQISKHGFKNEDDIFLMTMDGQGKIYVSPK